MSGHAVESPSSNRFDWAITSDLVKCGAVRPTIYLSLTDDWELRGNGSGDIERIQFRPMRELVRIYNKYGVRGTFNAEVMQQLTFREFEARHTELKTLADRWDEHVRETYGQGHDIQLHIHPQWSDARYEGGEWRLSGDWSILNYEPGQAHSMLRAGKEYLENLLRPVDPFYRCVSFRAGASIIAPSPHILSLLVKIGIEVDMSIVGGLHHDTRNVQLDYRNCEESFLPFYPRMEDSRRVSGRREEIVSVPIHHFHGSRRQFVKGLFSQVRRRAGRFTSAPAAKDGDGVSESYRRQEWAEKRHSSVLARINDKVVAPFLRGKHLTADLGVLSYPLMREMLRSIRRRARATGLPEVPMILSNHTKDIRDFAAIERFLGEASSAPDIRFITQSELAGKLRRGEFPVRKAASGQGRS
ncbi:MAG: hypothetical protein LC754_00175 [Acidobacteria bacterium]|nr:hypothetical protein [Acidobacteriota bacterium]